MNEKRDIGVGWTHSRTFIISQHTPVALPAEHVANNIKIKHSIPKQTNRLKCSGHLGLNKNEGLKTGVFRSEKKI